MYRITKHHSKPGMDNLQCYDISASLAVQHMHTFLRETRKTRLKDTNEFFLDTQTGITPEFSGITEVNNNPTVDNNPEVDNDPAIDNSLEVEVDPMIEIIKDDSPCVNIIDPPREPVKP